MDDTSKTDKPAARFRLSYNAPVILTFAVICTGIMAVGTFIPGFVTSFFVAPSRNSGFRLFSLDFFTLFSHALGHADWGHLFGNFSYILLIGPVLEEKYGSVKLILMMFITATITGILNLIFFSSGLLGASGIVFMLILLTSFTNYKPGQIPLTFILILLLFLGQEVYRALFVNNNISEFAHIIGGVCGAFFGFLFGTKKQPQDSVHVQ